MGILKGDNKNNILQPNPFSGDAVFKIYGYGGNDQIFGHASAHNIIDGGSGNDRIMGGSFKNTINGGAGHDDIMAGDGRDVITGGTGHDRMYGMGGGDRFVFKTVGEIGRAEGARDVIEDFKLGTFNGKDKIDLSQIDARSGTAKNDAFIFNPKEGAEFTGKKGELIWSSERPGGGFYAALLKGDANGDGKADFVLEITGSMDLFKGDFIL